MGEHNFEDGSKEGHDFTFPENENSERTTGDLLEKYHTALGIGSEATAQEIRAAFDSKIEGFKDETGALVISRGGVDRTEEFYSLMEAKKRLLEVAEKEQGREIYKPKIALKDETVYKLEEMEAAKIQRLAKALTALKTAKTEQDIIRIMQDYQESLPLENQGLPVLGLNEVARVVDGNKVFTVSAYVGSREGLVYRLVPSSELLQESKREVALSKWQHIVGNKYFRGILAYSVTGNFNNRDMLQVGDVEKFYEMYPNLTDYEEKGGITVLFAQIKAGNGEAKAQEYYKATNEFLRLMFPGQSERSGK